MEERKGVSAAILSAVLVFIVGLVSVIYGSAVWKTGFTVAVHQTVFYFGVVRINLVGNLFIYK